MANPFIHVELNTTDLARAKDFYGKLFGWKISDIDIPGSSLPNHRYTMIDAGTVPLPAAGGSEGGKPGIGVGGGMLPQMIPDMASFWLAYVVVDDVKAYAAKARALGAEIWKDETEVPGMGWLAIFKDPTGAVLGLWKPAPM